MKNQGAFFLILLTVVLWASAFVGIRAGLESYTPGCMALLRYLVASVVLLLVYSKQKTKTVPAINELAVIFLLGAVGFALYNIALNIGEQTVTAGISGFIVSQMPVFSIVLARFSLNERLTKLGWVGLCISIIGVCIIAYGERSNGSFNHGVWMLIIAAITGGIYTVYQKPLLKKFNSIELVSMMMWSGTIVLLGNAHHLIYEVMHASIASTLWVIYLGVFPAAFAYVCWAKALQSTSACKASSYLYWMPIIATLLGWMLLGEIPELLSLIGGLVALGGAVLIRVR